MSCEVKNVIYIIKYGCDEEHVSVYPMVGWLVALGLTTL